MMENKMWAMMLHLGYNQWHDRFSSFQGDDEDPIYRDFLYFEKSAWNEITRELPQHGFNTVLINLAEGVRLDSCPEIAVKGSLSKQELKQKLDRLRTMGFTVLPKLDFSAAHDAWLGEYHQTVGSKLYEALVCRIIDEVCELFDTPGYFHLGMGDENAQAQNGYGHLIIRQVNLYWREMYQMWDVLFKKGVRPWISSEYYSRYPKAFLAKMSPEVLISAEYAGRLYLPDPLDVHQTPPEQTAFETLISCGYDFIPEITIAGWRQTPNDMFRFAADALAEDKHFKGILASSQMATTQSNKYGILHIAQRYGVGKQEHWDKKYR